MNGAKLPCLKKTQTSYVDRSFDVYSKILLKPVSQGIVLIVTLGLLGVSVWGNVELRQEFDPMWFLPKTSYLGQWNIYYEKYV